MIVKASTDIEAIKKILNHPAVFHWVKDDNSPMNYTPIIHPSIIYLLDDTKSGMIRIDPMNSVTCSVHIACLPRMWGKAKEMVKESIKWGWENTKYQKIQAIIPAHNQHVIGLVQRCGFKEEGCLKKSYLINGKLEDQRVFGFCKGV